MRAWLVTADDRTGALEVAAEIAACAGPVFVTVDDPPEAEGVMDLGSRHVPVEAAEAHAEAAPVARWNAHKIDSTLRGNWSDEVRARVRVTGRRVVVVPAWPQMGRTCVVGVVAEVCLMGADGVAEAGGGSALTGASKVQWQRWRDRRRRATQSAAQAAAAGSGVAVSAAVLRWWWWWSPCACRERKIFSTQDK